MNEKLCSLSKQISSKAAYEEWRKRLKQDELPMMNTKKKDSLKKKIYRQSLTGDKLKLYNEKTKC